MPRNGLKTLPTYERHHHRYRITMRPIWAGETELYCSSSYQSKITELTVDRTRDRHLGRRGPLFLALCTTQGRWRSRFCRLEGTANRKCLRRNVDAKNDQPVASGMQPGNTIVDIPNQTLNSASNAVVIETCRTEIITEIHSATSSNTAKTQ